MVVSRLYDLESNECNFEAHTLHVMKLVFWAVCFVLKFGKDVLELAVLMEASSPLARTTKQSATGTS